MSELSDIKRGIITELLRMEEDCTYSSKSHFNSAEILRNLYYWLVIPLVIFTAITTKYYIVFIDLTGERPPNNANWTEEKPCDGVAFLVTDGADVVPLGPPEVDTRYVTATVSYPATIDNPEETFSQPMSYWDAKHVAWGNNVDSTEMMSLHFDRDLPASSPLKVNYPTPPALNEVKGCTEKTSPCDVVFEQYY